ncbi:MAG: hypothetical protein ACLTOV_09800 [Phocaeicola sp.]
MMVGNLGGEALNRVEWNEVYSEKGGKYQMCISYLPAKGHEREVNDRCLEVEVNGQKVRLDDLETDVEKGMSQVVFQVDLRKGYNSVKIGSDLYLDSRFRLLYFKANDSLNFSLNYYTQTL